MSARSGHDGPVYGANPEFDCQLHLDYRVIREAHPKACIQGLNRTAARLLIDEKNRRYYAFLEHWHRSIQVEHTLCEPAHPATSITGVDRGIARFITLADGFFVEPLNSFKKLEKKLTIPSSTMLNGNGVSTSIMRACKHGRRANQRKPRPRS